MSTMFTWDIILQNNAKNMNQNMVRIHFNNLLSECGKVSLLMGG